MTFDWQMALAHYIQLRPNYWTQMWLPEEKSKKSKEQIKSKLSFIELNLAVVELGNIVTMTSE